jgi:hypothetical protein
MPKIYQTDDGLPFVEVNGLPIVLGALQPDPTFKAAPEFRFSISVLQENLWVENSVKGAGVPIRNQRQFGSCAGQASCEALMYARSIRGLVKHNLSATFIYGMVNGGRDMGSRVGDCVATIKGTGTCLDSQVPWNVIYKKNFPANSFETAKRFKALEVFKIRNFDELCTALTLGFPCISGIGVGDNFTKGQLKENGIAPLPDVLVGGHAMCHTGLKRLDNMWVLETQNSWGEGWGLGGFCYLQKGHFNPGYGYGFDVYAVASVIEDPEDQSDNLPPIVTLPLPNKDNSTQEECNYAERIFE